MRGARRGSRTCGEGVQVRAAYRVAIPGQRANRDEDHMQPAVEPGELSSDV